MLPGGESGRAVVDFYVDDTGRVLLPEVVSASGEAAGWAALTAVNRWRFLPPRQGGQATMARGRVELSWPAPRNP
jgi:TonB family protein